MSRQTWKAGAIVQIVIGDDQACYALLLQKPYVAFFDFVSMPGNLPTLESLRRCKVAFIIGIYQEIITKGIWRIVERADELLSTITIPPFCIYDTISGRFSKYFKDGTTAPATREECEGLEQVAAWDSNHVEDRLRAMLEGVPDLWSESMRNRTKDTK